MKFVRRFTTADRPVVEQIEWKIVVVTGLGKEVTVPVVEVPANWSDNAAAILADKYLRKAGVPSETAREYEDLPFWLQRSSATSGATFGPETSSRQCFHRLAGCWTYWGWREGYFDDFASTGSGKPRGERAEEYAHTFYDEIYMMLALQIAAPNSPQWFNTGLHWAYGIEGSDTGQWVFDR